MILPELIMAVLKTIKIDPGIEFRLSE